MLDCIERNDLIHEGIATLTRNRRDGSLVFKYF